MLLVLAIALVVGFCMMLLKSYLLEHGMENVWNFLNWLLFQGITEVSGNTSIGLFYIAQTLFINGIQLSVVPLVLTSISLALCNITDSSRFGRIAIKTFVGFLFFYVIGCMFAILASVLSINSGWFDVDMSALAADTSTVEKYTVSNPLAILLRFVPNNIFSTWTVNSEILAVVFVAIVLGLAINSLGDQLKIIRTVLEDLGKIVGKYIDIVINRCAPVCIFCMIVRTLALYGWEQISSLLHYMLVTVIVLAFYWLIMYPFLLAITCRVNPIPFLKRLSKSGCLPFRSIHLRPRFH